MFRNLGLKELKNSICKVRDPLTVPPSKFRSTWTPSRSDLGKKYLGNEKRSRLSYRFESRPPSRRFCTTAYTSKDHNLIKHPTERRTQEKNKLSNTGKYHSIEILSFSGPRNHRLSEIEKGIAKKDGGQTSNTRSHSLITDGKEMGALCRKGLSSSTLLFVKKEHYSTADRDNMVMDKKSKTKEYPHKELVTNRGINSLEKQIEHINDIMNKQFKKSIHSAKTLQSTVLEKIREVNRNDGINMNRLLKKDDNKKVNNPNPSMSGHLIDKKEFNSSFPSKPVKHPINDDIMQRNSNNVFDILKKKYYKQVISQKDMSVSPQQLPTSENKNAVDNQNPKILKTEIQEEFPNKEEKMKRVEAQTTAHSRPISNVIGGNLQHPSQENSNSASGTRDKLEYIESELNSEPSCINEKNQAKDNFKSKTSLNAIVASSKLEPVKALSNKFQLKNMIENSVRNPIECIVKNDKNSEMSNSTDISNDKRRIGTDRDNRKRSNINYQFNQSNTLSNQHIAFSHKCLYLNTDLKTYNEMKNLERKKFFDTVYTRHWVERRPPSLLPLKPEVLQRPRSQSKPKPVVHKLNPAELAAKLKIKAKEINSKNLMDETLRPQLYCRKNIVMGLAQMPIMPCVNIINRNRKPTIYSKSMLNDSKKNTKSQVKRRGASSNPIWPQQKWISDSETSKLIPDTNLKHKKTDFKGTLRYIMNFRARLHKRKKS